MRDAPLQFPVPYVEDAAQRFAALRPLGDAIWLDSNRSRQAQGAYDIISAAPTAVLTASSDQGCMRTANGRDETLACGFLEALREELAPWSQPATGPASGGALGYFGYDIARPWFGLPSPVQGDTGIPQARVGVYEWLLVHDHQRREAQVRIHPKCRDSLRVWLREWARQLEAPQTSGEPPAFRLITPWTARTSPTEYHSQFDRIQQYIRAGDCYQVNLAQRFDARYRGDPFEAYLRLRAQSPAPYSAFIELPEGAILSLSPEQFLQVEDRTISTRPIKGTRPRNGDPLEDHRLAKALLHSTKDRAENLMIVDLLRNDIGRCAVPGSVQVPSLFELQSFANVHHLVSTVVGTLAAKHTPLDLLRACLPGGSITGAPKQRAMEIINELEPYARSLYCGTIGMVDFTGGMRTNIAIRTLVCNQGQAHLWGGGGIVADSDVALEYEESFAKIRNLMDALGSPQCASTHAPP